MNDIRTVLLTTDFSDTSRKAFPYAREIARRFGAKVILAHVEEGYLPPPIIEYANVGIEEIERRQQECAEERLEALRDEFDSEIPVEIEVASGTPHLRIVEMAKRHGADLIVMAGHGRNFISHAILGSTTERVLRRAPCPVFAVRDRAEE